MKPLKYPISNRPKSYAWEPTIISRNDQQYVKISPGTINYLLPTNWQSEFVLAEGEINYIKVRVFSAGGGEFGWAVTGCELFVDTLEPTPTLPRKTSPPITFEFAIGVYYDGEYKPIFDTSIFLYPVIFYTTPKENPATGDESFDKYFIWQHA